MTDPEDRELANAWDSAYSQGVYEALIALEGIDIAAFNKLLEVKHFQEIWDHFTK